MVAKKAFNKAENLKLLKKLGLQDESISATDFLRMNPDRIREYELLRSSYEGQESFKATKATNNALTGEDLQRVKQGGGISAITGKILDKQSYTQERTALGDLPSKLNQKKAELAQTTDANSKTVLQTEINRLESELNNKKQPFIQTDTTLDKRYGNMQAFSPLERALRDAGYTGVFDGTETRWLEKQDKATIDKYTAQNIVYDTIYNTHEKGIQKQYGSLKDFVSIGSFSDPSLDINYKGIATQTAREKAMSEYGKGLNSLEPLKLAKIGFDVARIFGGNSAAMSGLTSSVNAFGASALGLYNPVPVGASIGPVAPTAGIGGATTLTGMLSSAGIGAGIGAGISYVAGTHATGATIGGGIGGAVGSIVPGIGTVVGAVIGSTIGGSFGSEAHPFSDFTGTVKDGALNYDTGSKHMTDQFGNNMGNMASQYLAEVQKTTGLKLEGMGIAGGFAQDQYYLRSGYYRSSDGKLRDWDDTYETKVSFDPKNATTVNKAFADITVDYISKTSSEVRELIAEGVQSQDILGALQARYSKAFPDANTGSGSATGGSSNAPIDITKPILPTDPPKVKIAKQANIMQTQVNDFLDRTAKGKIGIKGTYHTSARGLLDEATTKKARLLG